MQEKILNKTITNREESRKESLSAREYWKKKREQEEEIARKFWDFVESSESKNE